MNVIVPFPAVATSGRGETELVNGVPVADALVLVLLVVTVFVAVITTVYSTSSVSPVITHDVDVVDGQLTADPLVGVAVAIYESEFPPFEVGASHSTVRRVGPGTTRVITGAVGLTAPIVTVIVSVTDFNSESVVLVAPG